MRGLVYYKCQNTRNPVGQLFTVYYISNQPIVGIKRTVNNQQKGRCNWTYARHLSLDLTIKGTFTGTYHDTATKMLYTILFKESFSTGTSKMSRNIWPQNSRKRKIIQAPLKSDLYPVGLLRLAIFNQSLLTIRLKFRLVLI